MGWALLGWGGGGGAFLAGGVWEEDAWVVVVAVVGEIRDWYGDGCCLLGKL